ncbi:Mitochondrial porin, partial [Lathyrus oleraceus]
KKARDLLYKDYHSDKKFTISTYSPTGVAITSSGTKKARDLLYKDYHSDKKFTISTYSPTGVAITSSGTKKGELFLGDVNTQLKNKNITTDIKVDTNSNLFTTITV